MKSRYVELFFSLMSKSSPLIFGIHSLICKIQKPIHVDSEIMLYGLSLLAYRILHIPSSKMLRVTSAFVNPLGHMQFGN